MERTNIADSALSISVQSSLVLANSDSATKVWCLFPQWWWCSTAVLDRQRDHLASLLQKHPWDLASSLTHRGTSALISPCFQGRGRAGEQLRERPEIFFECFNFRVPRLLAIVISIQWICFVYQVDFGTVSIKAHGSQSGYLRHWPLPSCQGSHQWFVELLMYCIALIELLNRQFHINKGLGFL